MRPVSWSPTAIRDVRRIHEYIEQYDPAAATRIAGELLASTDVLGRFPYVGRPAPAGRRELIVGRYVVVYRARPSETRILRVWHGAQDRP